MKRFESHIIGVDDGEVVLFSDFENDGPMWSGTGPRLYKAQVTFSETYREIPAVKTWVSMWDVSNLTNTRMDVMTEDVTVSGFTVVFRTWGDTKVARVRIGWQAIGPLKSEDDWELY